MRKLLVIAAITVTVALATLNDAAAAVPVLLDPSFDGDGRVTTDVGHSFYEDEFFALVQQPDGKLVAGGRARNPANNNFDFTLVRYRPDGSLDTSFSGDGIVTTDFLGGFDEIHGLALQPDGKLVAAGFAYNSVTGADDFALARYNPDGSLDTSFATYGDDGVGMTDFYGGTDVAFSLVLQPDGKLVLAGFAQNPSTGGYDFALARYLPDGNLDPSFSGDGRVTTDFLGSTDGALKLALQPDGKLVAAGLSFNTATGNFDFALARYNTDGSLDTSFATYGADGVGVTDFYGFTDVAFGLVIQPDGKLVLSGFAHNPSTGNLDFALARYLPDGNLDPSFDGDGRVTTDFAGGFDEALALTLQPDGKLLAAGLATSPGTGIDFGLARYNADGSLDTSFGNGGRLVTDFYGGADGIHALVVQWDGKVVAAGDAFNPHTGGDDFALARYLMADPSWIAGVVASLPDKVFAAGKKATILNALSLIAGDIQSGNISAALLKLQDLRSRMDGCPPGPDVDDWVVNCLAQTQLRTLIDQLAAKLRSS